MKTIIILTVIVFSLSCYSSAQIPIDTKSGLSIPDKKKKPLFLSDNIHLGIGIASEGNSLLLINFRGYLNLGKHFRFAPAFNFPKIGGYYKTVNLLKIEEYKLLWKTDINFHYIFNPRNKISLYAITGISFEKNRNTTTNNFLMQKNISDSFDSQLNLGVGSEARLNKNIKLFIELQYNSRGRALGSIGALFKF